MITIERIEKHSEQDIDSIAKLAELFYSEFNGNNVYGRFNKQYFTEFLHLSSPSLITWLGKYNNMFISCLPMLLYKSPWSQELVLEEMFWYCIPNYRGKIPVRALFYSIDKYAEQKKIFNISFSNKVGINSEKMSLILKKFGYSLEQNQYYKSLQR